MLITDWPCKSYNCVYVILSESWLVYLDLAVELDFWTVKSYCFANQILRICFHWLFLIKDMQTPLPPPPEKWSEFYERCRMYWIKWNNFFFAIWPRLKEGESSRNISLNAVEHKPVPTRVLNPNASYKPKQRSYRFFSSLFFFRVDFGCGDFIREPDMQTPSPSLLRKRGG